MASFNKTVKQFLKISQQKNDQNVSAKEKQSKQDRSYYCTLHMILLLGIVRYNPQSPTVPLLLH